MISIEKRIELRPCYAKGKKALFHRWFEHHFIVPPKIAIGSPPTGGEETCLYAIVEYEDGTVEGIFPRDIVFADSEFKEYAFQPLREKGTGND